MNEYRTKLGQDGRILIPIFVRRQLHLNPGEELVIHVEDEELHLSSLKHALKKSQTIVREYSKNQSLVQKLKSMRKQESQDE